MSKYLKHKDMKVTMNLMIYFCLMVFGNLLQAQVVADYYDDDLSSIGMGGTAASVSKIDLDTTCQAFRISIVDPVEAPLPAYNAYTFTTIDTLGNPILDITDNVNVTMRIRSAESIRIDVLFRSGGGTSDERTERKGFDVPGRLDQWTEFTLAWETNDLAGFVSTNLKDMWFYLDRGEANFGGNELYIDHIIVGGDVDTNKYSPCYKGDEEPFGFEEYFDGDTLSTINAFSIAGQATSFTIDTICETLLLSIKDPTSVPLSAYNAYQVKPIDYKGLLLQNIDGVVNTTFRVRSREAVTFDVLFRSGLGGTEERSLRKSFGVPAGLDNWTEFTLAWTVNEFEGFNPMDMIDMWFYLDRGVENFAGNELYIDHITIGVAPDGNKNTPCLLDNGPQEWVENWANNMTTKINSSDIERLNITVDEICEELKIEVIDPIGDPFQALRPLFLDPLDVNGINIKTIDKNPIVNIRARSAADVELGVLLRSKDGTADFRTDLLTKTIVGSLEGYTNLVFEFDQISLKDFDEENFLDIWIYLDREIDNFNGNEIYFDFVSLGESVDVSAHSPCGLPDLLLDDIEDIEIEKINAYPNPAVDLIRVSLPASNILENITYNVYSMLGNKIIAQKVTNLNSFEINLVDIEAGIYFVNIYSNEQIIKTIKFIKVEK